MKGPRLRSRAEQKWTTLCCPAREVCHGTGIPRAAGNPVYPIRSLVSDWRRGCGWEFGDDGLKGVSSIATGNGEDSIPVV